MGTSIYYEDNDEVDIKSLVPVFAITTIIYIFSVLTLFIEIFYKNKKRAF